MLGCKSLGDTYKNTAKPNEGGTLLMSGTWHLVRGDKGVPPELMLFSLKELHIECSNEKLTLTILTLMKGSVLGKITTKKGTKNEFEVEVRAERAKQEFTEYENDAGTLVKAALEASMNGEPLFAVGENSSTATLKTTLDTELLES